MQAQRKGSFFSGRNRTGTGKGPSKIGFFGGISGRHSTKFVFHFQRNSKKTDLSPSKFDTKNRFFPNFRRSGWILRDPAGKSIFRLPDRQTPANPIFWLPDRQTPANHRFPWNPSISVESVDFRLSTQESRWIPENPAANPGIPLATQESRWQPRNPAGIRSGSAQELLRI